MPNGWCRVGEESKPGSPIFLYCVAQAVREYRFFWPIPGGAIEVEVCEEHNEVLARKLAAFTAVRPKFVRMPPVVFPPQRASEGSADYSARVHMWRTWLLHEPRPDTWYSGDDAVREYRQWRDTDPVARWKAGERNA